MDAPLTIFPAPVMSMSILHGTIEHRLHRYAKITVESTNSWCKSEQRQEIQGDLRDFDGLL